MDFLRANWISLTVIAVVVIGLWSTLGRRKAKGVGESIQVNGKCMKCGWQGTVSKYAISCRKCGNKNLNIF